MAVKPPTLYLLGGTTSATKAALADSVTEEFGVDVVSIDQVNARRGYTVGDPRINESVIEAAVEVIVFEIITSGMSGQSIAIDDSSGDQSILDRFIANAKGAGMKVKVLTA